MTLENKDLLLKDLCARLPYGVFIKDRNGVRQLTIGNTELADLFYGKCNIKPYLRPMESMTEEEMKEYERLHEGIAEINDAAFIALNDFLNSNHFDYHGLIPMRLAIEVTEENNPYKE